MTCRILAGCFLIAFALVFPKAINAQSNPAATSTQSPSGEQSVSRAEAATSTEEKTIWTRDTLTGDWMGVRTKLEAAGIKFGLQEQSEVWANVAGGVRRGVVYDGLTAGNVSVDLEKLLGWTGAKLYSNAFQIHGSGPTINLVGNLLTVSNIEATRDTKLYQLWIEQALLNGRLTIRVGQEGVNDELIATKYGALFLNSTFGLPGMSALNLPSGGPDYPIATPFARVSFQATDNLTLIGAVFNGDPAPGAIGDPQLRDKGGIAFRTNAHVLAVGEIWYSINQGDNASGLPGIYKFGAWTHSGHFADQSRDTNGVSLASPFSNGVPLPHSPGFAVYAIAEQMIWKKSGTKTQGIGVFVDIMGGSGQFNLSNIFVEAGLNWTGPFEGRDNDVVGLAFAYLGISPTKRQFGNDLIHFTGQGSPYRSNETVIEATYQFQVTPWWSLQPDLQIIVNPGAGIQGNVGHAVIAGVRTGITF